MEDHLSSSKTFSAETPSKNDQEFPIPFGGSLEGIVNLSQSAEGVDVQCLAEHALISIWTQNTYYRIQLLDPQKGVASVQGGAYFAEPTEAVIRGSTFGGAVLKIGWIEIGLQIEMEYQPILGQKQSILTSPVAALQLEHT